MKVKGHGIGKFDHANYRVVNDPKDAVLVINKHGVKCYRLSWNVRASDHILQLNILERLCERTALP